MLRVSTRHITISIFGVLALCLWAISKRVAGAKELVNAFLAHFASVKLPLTQSATGQPEFQCEEKLKKRRGRPRKK